LTRIGPAGWAYKDWNGIVYPSPKPRGFKEPAFLARYFDTLEINVSFYRPIEAATALRWLKLIEENPRFRFTAKLWRGFTHERNWAAPDEDAVRHGLGPILEAGRLGALLLQFAHSFRNTDENRAYVAKLRETFQDYPIVLEVRHRSWTEPGLLDFLESLGVGLCNIDQPIFKESIRPSAIATSPVGYIRLHGRRYDSWFTENEYVGQRYDYQYSPEELAPWVDRVKALEQAAEDTYVVTNNHYLGKAVVNAIEIASLLKEKPVAAPAVLLNRYPELQGFAEKDQEGTEPEQMSLL
jgi:uncharacterized protein YecE (DUF72 family)